MTDAYVNKTVSNATETETTNQFEDATNKNKSNEENCLPDNLKNNLNCNCNETHDPKAETQIQSNVLSNSSKSDNFTNSIGNSQNNQSAVVGHSDPNSVFKYVYKKNEAKSVSAKTTGHPKNALRRRKRSENLENLHGTKAPLIVNYETSHGPPRDVEVWLPAKNTANVIKNSALADFNIETLHDNEQQKNIRGPSTERIPENANDSNESVDRENQINTVAKSRTNSEESNEQNNESLENSAENEEYSRNNEKYSDSQANYKNENTENERDGSSSIELENSDAKSSKEDSDSNSKEYDKSKYTTTSNGPSESVENSSEETDKSNVSYPNKDEEPNSDEESNSKYKTQERHQYKPEYVNKPNSPKIQDVDLGEYERIQVNKNGQIETAPEIHENTSFDPARDVILTTKPDNGIKQSEKISSLSKDNTDSSSLESHDHKEPTHINDGEVKPVVEINSDVYSTESSEENSNEALKAKLQNESLETLTGVNEKDSDEKSDKIQEYSKSQNQGDVKQQFERIPLNYNHSNKKQSTGSKVDAKEQTNDNGNDEGTIDKLKPRYDENLNIKFDDINIKLPEIKLPDDILSYAYENPPVYKDEQPEKPFYYQDTPNYNNKKNEQRDRSKHYQDSSNYNRNNGAQREKPTYYKDSSIYNKNKEEQVEKPSYYRKDKEEKLKPKFYHYSDEVEDEPRARIKQEENDDEDDDRNGYYGYYADKTKKEDYRQKPNNDNEKDDDDLYEKFVRERFGKRGSFEKRLEKLTDYKAQNPHLYQKVQKILAKTKDVKSEAEKSGDPNAGYMWTLEYGEKL